MSPNFESAKLHSVPALCPTCSRVPHATCPTCSRASRAPCSTCFGAPHASWPTCSLASYDLCSTCLCSSLTLCLHTLVPHVPCALHALMPHLLSCLPCSSCLVHCVLQATISDFCTLLFPFYFQLVSCSGKFATTEMTVTINQQYDVLKLFSEK